MTGKSDELDELRAKNRRLALALAKAQADLKEISDCRYCARGTVTGRCTSTKENTRGGSCFIWRGKDSV